MHETIRLLGPDRRLISVLTAPTTSGDEPPLGCILVNAGVIHRIGPHRINVKVARALAAQGIASIRLDLSGRGDSPASKSSLTLPQQTVVDVQLAMDELAREYGCERFVMFGICSGAVVAMDAAAQDARLVGVCLYDGFAYPTWKTKLVYYWRSITGRSATLVAQSVGRNLAAIGNLLGKRSGPDLPAVNLGIGDLPVETYRGFLESMAARGANVWVVFTGSVGHVYNHAGQFDAVFASPALAGRVHCDYLPQLDHTLTTQASQRDWIERLVGWAQSCAPAEGRRQARSPGSLSSSTLEGGAMPAAALRVAGGTVLRRS